MEIEGNVKAKELGFVATSSIDERIELGTNCYYARVLPTQDICETLELKIRAVNDKHKWFSCFSEYGDQQAFIFNYNEVDKVVFFNKQEAGEIVSDHQDERKLYKHQKATFED